MGGRTLTGESAARAASAAGLVLLALGLLSCVGPRTPFPESYRWFEAPRDADPWRAPIREWQARVRAHQDGAEAPKAHPTRAVSAALPRRGAEVGDTSSLADAYHRFQRDERKRIVGEVAVWIQEQARHHFVPDPGIDIWPTPEEVLASGGDDCDGLAFLAHRLLLGLGFDEDELFLAIVRRDRDGLHHMIGLWFGDGEDPWIVDPTGAMTTKLVRMSEIGGWEPLAVFTETSHFRALPHVAQAPPAD